MSTLTLEQFEQLIETNVLTDPPMYVRNTSFPKGQVSFNVLGSDFRMRNVIIPVSGSAIDLTQYAPLQNLLASAELREVFASRHLVLVNQDDMPEPNNQKFPDYTNVTTPVTEGDANIDGLAPAGTQVQAVHSGNIAAVFAESNNTFELPVPNMVAGDQIEVSFIKDKFETKKVSVVVAEKPAQPYPQPTVNDYTNFDSEISGTTIQGATVVLKNDGAVVDTKTVGSDGKFSLTVPYPHGVLEVSFSADGYTPTTVTPAPKDREVNVTVNTPKYLDEEITLNINPAQPVPVHVEIEIDGQALITDTIPENVQSFDVVCGAIKGNVKVTVKSTGYKETSFTRTPTKNAFGNVTVNAVHAEEKVVAGSVAMRSADDVKVELVTLEKTYNANVNADGTFSVTTDALNAGDASVHFTSNYFDPKTQDFDILAKEISTATVNDVYAGDTVITGTTLAGVKVVSGSHQTTAGSDGKFSLTVDALEAGNSTLEFSKTNYTTKTVPFTIMPLRMQATPTAQTVYVGETDIHGTAEPGAQIFIDGNKVGDVESDGNFTLSGPAMSAAENLTFKKLHYRDETLVVTPQALSNFSKPTLTITEGDTTISGTTTAGTLVTSTSATASVTANGSGAFTMTLKSAAVANAKIEIGLAKRGYANASFEFTVAAKPAP